MIHYTLAILLTALQGCTLLNPEMCRYATGEVSLNITGGPTGGNLIAKVEKGGHYFSYPASASGVCTAPPALPSPLPSPSDPPES